MAYQPGIFQYGTIGADGGGYGDDDYGFGTDQIYTLPPFKVNENTGNTGTGLNNTFTDADAQALYNAGLTGGNIFTGGTGGGGGGGGSGAGTVTAGAGGYTDPANQDLFNKGLIGPAGDPSNLAANPNANPALINYINPTSAPIILPKVTVNETNLAGAGGYIDPVNQDLFNRGLIGPAGDAANIGGVVTPSSGAVILPPVEVAGTKINTGLDSAAALNLLNSIGSGVVSAGATPSSGIVTLPPVQVPGSRLPNNGIDPAAVLRLIQQGYNPANTFTDEIVTMAPVYVTPGVIVTPGSTPVVLPPVIVTPGSTPIVLPPVVVTPGPTVRITVPNVSIPPVTPSNFSPNVTYPPITSSRATTTPAPTSAVSVTSSVPFDPNTINTGVGTYGTNAQTLTTKRDFGKELAETLAALKTNQSGIMGMYGDLYKQFMPKGITDTESSIIDQYKTDLSRLQQRQAGVLAPEDIRQSQQAAREAYGARGQVMGRGAIGAEIMGRENIRQQREDQARVGMQSSYKNIMDMANLQTGNIFSPIGNLMSNTFNPVSPYAGDVYGTNVNAQLAKEIAQKNYDAAVRSAELSGAASKSASNTDFWGNVIKAGAQIKLGLQCMPGYQCIDTPNGPVPIQDLRGGDYVIGYDNTVKRIEQLCSYVENPETEFLKFALADGRSITVCGPHKILDIPAREWVVGSEMNGVPIVSIGKVTGVTTSYDLLTDVGGYRIAGVPVNSMIPEMIVQTIKQVLLNHA